MKLVTYRESDTERAGVFVDGGADSSRSVVLDLGTSFAWFEREAGRPHDDASILEKYGRGVLGFIEHDEDARSTADRLVSLYLDKRLPLQFEGKPLTRRLSEVALMAPIPRPPSMRDGYAFRQHVATARKNRGLEMIPEFDQFPVFYFTNHQSVIGPGALEVQALHLDKLDFELEAAIVVGKKSRNLTAQNADASIFGMTIMNDFSARALQMEEMKMSLGPAKGKDFATALGPVLVTRDELEGRKTETKTGASYDLEMRAFVNGLQVSKGNLKDMNWTFAQILERASYGVTLYPGDVIGSGTCGTGCFLELNGSKVTDNQWLKVGDVVALEIDGIGRLENRVTRV